jgi:hypothetical protein
MVDREWREKVLDNGVRQYVYYDEGKPPLKSYAAARCFRLRLKYLNPVRQTQS